MRVAWLKSSLRGKPARRLARDVAGGSGVSSLMGDAMRARLILGLVVLALTAGAAASGVHASVGGRLAGVTQITFGCPGPIREGAPPCEHWSRFPHARFSITRLRGNVPVPGTDRRVSSDSRGRFTLQLVPGRYRLTPLPQPHTNGGTPVTVAVRTGQTTWTLVRFQGYPRML